VASLAEQRSIRRMRMQEAQAAVINRLSQDGSEGDEAALQRAVVEEALSRVDADVQVVAAVPQAAPQAEEKKPVAPRKPTITIAHLQQCLRKCPVVSNKDLHEELDPYLRRDASTLRYMAGSPSVVMTAQFVCHLKTHYGENAFKPRTAEESPIRTVFQRVAITKGEVDAEG
jgi:hypothetical protein